MSSNKNFILVFMILFVKIGKTAIKICLLNIKYLKIRELKQIFSVILSKREKKSIKSK